MPTERVKTPHATKTRKAHHPPSETKIVMCKVYSNECGHCIRLAPKWEQMKKILGNKVDIVDIEASNSTNGIADLKQKYGVNEDIKVDGYPTIFRVENGTVSYYGGNREAHDMAKWAIKPERPAVWRGGKNKKTNKKKTKKRVRFLGIW